MKQVIDVEKRRSSFTTIIKILIVVLFADLWVDLFMHIGQFFSVELFFFLGLIIPISILVAVLKKNSHVAYNLVILICIFSMLVRFEELINFIKLYLNEEWYGSTPIELEIRRAFISLCCSFVILALLHIKRIVKLYNWQLKSFLLAILGALLIYLILLLLPAL